MCSTHTLIVLPMSGSLGLDGVCVLNIASASIHSTLDIFTQCYSLFTQHQGYGPRFRDALSQSLSHSLLQRSDFLTSGSVKDPPALWGAWRGGRALHLPWKMLNPSNGTSYLQGSTTPLQRLGSLFCTSTILNQIRPNHAVFLLTVTP